MKKSFIVLFLFLTVQLFGQSNEKFIGGQIGLSMPLGDFSEVAKTGFGFLGNFAFTINQDLDIIGTIGYFTHGRAIPDRIQKKIDAAIDEWNEIYNNVGVNGVVEVDSDNGDYSVIPIIVGGRYFLKREKFSPYGIAELGIHFFSSSRDIKVTYDEPYLDENTLSWKTKKKTETIDLGGDSSSNEFGLGLGVGFLYDIGNIKLDVNVKFNIISDYNHFTVLCGVLFPIP